MRFLFVDRILELVEGQFIRGLKHVTSDDAFLYVTATGLAYFPPALIGETLGQLAAWNVMLTQDFQHRPVAGIAQEAISLRPVHAGETLLLESFIDHLDTSVVTYHSVASVGDEPVFILNGALGPLLPMRDFIDESLVRLQFQQIFRPGAWPPANDKPTPLLTDLPKRPMPWLYFDRILDHEPHKKITAEKKITFSAPYFPDHFPKKPVLPLTVLLECILNLATHLVAPQKKTVGFSTPSIDFADKPRDEGFRPNCQQRPVRLTKIKMKAFIQPGDVIRTTLAVRSQSAHDITLQSITELDGKRICVAELSYPKE